MNIYVYSLLAMFPTYMCKQGLFDIYTIKAEINTIKGIVSASSKGMFDVSESH